MQLEAMLANLNNRDVLLVLASGGQSPAIRYASLCLPHVSNTQRHACMGMLIYYYDMIDATIQCWQLAMHTASTAPEPETEPGRTILLHNESYTCMGNLASKFTII